MIRKYTFLTFCCILLCPSIGLYSQGILTGTVIDAGSQEPLVGATIQSADAGTTTDIEGNYRIVLPEGSNVLQFSYLGYRDLSVTVDISNEKEMTLDTEMDAANVLLETTTITGSRYEHRLAESTVALEVIPSDFIESTNTTRVDQILDKVPGVQIIDGQPNIRGGSGWSFGAGSRVLLLVDDMPALQGDAGLAQWADIPVENISQIEVVKGAASALYGSAALNGIINIRTGYATSEPVTKISLFHTRFDGPKDKKKQWWTETPRSGGFSLLHKQKFGKLDLVAGAFYNNLDSLYSFNQNTFENKARTNLNLRYRATDRLTFGVNTLFNKGLTSSFFIWFNGSDRAYRPTAGTVSTSDNVRYFIDPYVNYYDRKNNRHQLRTRYYYINNENSGGRSNQSDSYFAEYQFQRIFEESNTTLTAGVVGNWISSDSQLFSDTIISSENYASFVQLDKRLFDKLKLSGGLRYEYNVQNTPTNFQGKVIPNGKIDEGKLVSRIGANLEVTEYSFLRASWGQGYRYPTITERFIRTSFSGFTIFANPFLNSETGWSSEVGIKQGFRFFGFEGFLDVASFWSEYSSMMEFTFHQEDGLTGFQSQNIGSTQIKGVELSVAGRSNFFSIPVRLFAGYSYIDPIYKSFSPEIESASSVDYNILKYRNKHQMVFDIEAEWKNIIAGVALTGASHMEAIDAQLSIFASIGSYRDFNNMGYRKYDARLAYQYKDIKLSALVNNLLNEEYTERPGLLEAPRNYSVRMDLTL